MRDYRCKFCHRLLLKLSEQKESVKIEVKCPKCKKINIFKVPIDYNYWKGQSLSEVNCLTN